MAADGGLALAAHNAVTMWTRVAAARGYATVERTGFLAVSGAPTGLRVLTRTPALTPSDLGELRSLVGAAPRAQVEDAFGRLDLSALGLTSRRLPVMIRPADPDLAEPAVTVVPVRTAEDLAVAERVVVDGFPLEPFQPYRSRVAFPPSLLATCGLHLARVGATPAGACLVVPEPAAVGVYWVTTLPAFRSRGVGRALMHAVLREYADRPTTLTASRFGRPLYDSLGFRVLAEAVWWATGPPAATGT